MTKPQEKKLEEMSALELKAAYYDQLVQIETQDKILKLMRDNLAKINNAVAAKVGAPLSQDVSPAPEKKVAKETLARNTQKPMKAAHA